MKKFNFVINGNAYEVDVLGFEENIAKIGENIVIRQFKRIELGVNE